MLNITQISAYDLPRYPQAGQYIYPPISPTRKVGNAAALMALAALLDACDDRVTSGVPQPPPILSEQIARQVINQVFTDHQLALLADRELTIHTSPIDSSLITLDGFNDSLQVGYEYLSQGEINQCDFRIWSHLDSLKYIQPPHILVVEPVNQSAVAEEYLEQVVDKFLDSLQAHGII